MARIIALEECLHWPSPDVQTRSSDGELTLLPSQRIVRRYTKQRSFQLVGTCCTVGVPVADRGHLLSTGPSLVGPPNRHLFRQSVAVTCTVSRSTLPDFDVLRAADHEERSPVCESTLQAPSVDTSWSSSVPSFRHHCVADRAPSPCVFVCVFVCTARRFTPLLMVVTPEAGTPCTEPRVWQLSVFPLRLARPLCPLGVSRASGLRLPRFCEFVPKVCVVQRKLVHTCVKTLYLSSVHPVATQIMS